MNTDKETITLISSELNHVKINLKAAVRSNLIKYLINDFPEAGDINLNGIKYEILLKIKEYLEHYEILEPKEITQPLPKKDLRECIDSWDYEYINLENETIFEIMMAANFMDIQPLLELTCAKIASEIKGKNEEEIRNLFKMEKDCDEDEDSIENDVTEYNIDF